MNTSDTIGAAATAAWIEQRGLDVSRTKQWYIEVTISSDSTDTRLEINIYPEEWGIVFRRGIRVSSIRVTDAAFVHGLDDHNLLPQLPDLERIDDLLVSIEKRYNVAFSRIRALVRSNLVRAAPIVRAWLADAR